MSDPLIATTSWAKEGFQAYLAGTIRGLNPYAIDAFSLGYRDPYRFNAVRHWFKGWDQAEADSVQRALFVSLNVKLKT